MKNIKSILIVICLITISVYAENDSARVYINKWLIAGPIPVEMPVEPGFGDAKYQDKDVLNFEPIPIYSLTPAEEEMLLWGKENEFEWESEDAEELEFSSSDKTLPEVYYAVTYLDVQRWLKAKIEIKSCQMLKTYLDGKEIAFKTSTQAEKNENDCKAEKASKDIELERGSHVLVIKALRSPKIEANWHIQASLLIDSTYSAKDITISTKHIEYATVEKLLEDPKISDISISADGEFAAVTVSDIPFGEDTKETWIDIYKTSNASLYRSFKGLPSLASVKWAPSGKRFTYTSSEKNETTLWLVDLDKGTSEALLTDEKDFASYEWAPDESYIIYSVTEKASEDKSGIKIIKGMNERLPDAANKTFLYKLSIQGKVKSRLTAGDKSFNLYSISRDSKKLLLSVQNYDWSKRPFSSYTFSILDIEKMRLDSLAAFTWAGSAQFSPDGEKILFTGGPSMFGNIGIKVSSDMIPNEFDTQAYLYDLDSKETEAISLDFDPSITSAYWSTTREAIYFNTIDKSLQRLYRYNLENKKFELVKLAIDVLEDIQFAAGKDEAVYKGSSAIVPDRFYYINLKSGQSKLLYNPAEESYKNVVPGKSEKWTFKNSRGEDIDGTVYYPPNFDKNKKYPAIINYYGGTSPIEDAYEGRYPKNIWTAHGYIVYILQPSGAVGYGQQFSAYHVNDWGNTTAQEVIDGTRIFLQEHPFVDSTRIGCIGASYGGFLTMNLLTKTKMFTAGISHAGISNLADYWGVGYWGYEYSAVATADSYPWNRKDIYIDYSPIFSADKIITPLLLLHGASDTNVPPGESTQMFTALKLLGKDVEYIQVAGQDHHIMDYKKRKQWTKTIIAYFDKYLKGQPQWWDSMYSGEK